MNTKLGIPLNAQLCVTAIVAILGCLYLGSSTAFNALLGSAVTINNLAYIIPVLTNVVLRRKTMYKGTFHMGQTKGMIVNIVTIAWLVFAIVFFSFPYYMPVTGKYPMMFLQKASNLITFGVAVNMNYTCLIVGGFILLETLWWFKAGKEYTARMLKAREDSNNTTPVEM